MQKRAFALASSAERLQAVLQMLLFGKIRSGEACRAYPVHAVIPEAMAVASLAGFLVMAIGILGEIVPGSTVCSLAISRNLTPLGTSGA